jgi:hypothetical protein
LSTALFALSTPFGALSAQAAWLPPVMQAGVPSCISVIRG